MDPIGLDVTVTLYNGAGGFGHIGTGVNTTITEGFYPDPNSNGLKVAAGRNVPGVLHVDTAAPIDTITIPATPEQDRAIQAAIDAERANPTEYNLYQNNCAQKAAQFLNAGNLNIVPRMKPRELFEALRRQFAPRPAEAPTAP